MADVQRADVQRTDVMVFGPNPFVSIAIESMVTGADGDEIHFHAAGQGVWVARAAAGLGGIVTIVSTRGGEHGTLLAALVGEEPFEAVFVTVAGEGAWSPSRRSSTHDLRASETPVVADLSGSLAEAARRGGLDVLKMSESEATALEGHDTNDSAGLRDVAERLAQRGARRVVITRGAEPAIAVDEHGVRELLVPKLAAADHRGAGDSMTAALAIELAGDDPWEDVLACAAAAGATNVTRHGLGTSSDAEIRAIRALASSSPPQQEQTRRTS